MSSISLTGSVLTHPRRLDMARALHTSLHSAAIDLVVDPKPDGPPTALRTATAAWSAVPETSTHHLILEDDAVPTPGFLRQVELAVAAAPDAAIAFYTNWQSRNGAAVRLGQLAGARWTMAVDEYAPTVSIVLPSVVGRGFPAFAARAGGNWPDDILMARYLRQRDVPLYLSVPNLIEQDDVASVDGHHAYLLGRAVCLPHDEPAQPWRLDNLLRPDAVPLLEGTASGLLRQDPPIRWMQVRAARCLRRLGLPADGWRTSFEKATIGTVDGRLAPPLAAELWQVAYLLGAEARQLRATDALADVLAGWDSATSRDALATLGLASICDGLSMRQARQWWDQLGALVGEAAAAGARDVGESRSEADRKRRRVLLLGDGRPLATHLRSDLADRGFDVLTSHRTDIDAVVVVDGADQGCPLPEDVRTVRVAVTAVRPDGSVTGHDWPPATGTTVLRAGMPYGPGLGGDTYSPINEYVRQMLMEQPPPAKVPHDDPFRPAHVWDIAQAVADLLETPTPPEVADVGGNDPMTLDQLATAINGERPLPSRPDRVGLGDGIATVALWLLYHSDN